MFTSLIFTAKSNRVSRGAHKEKKELLLVLKMSSFCDLASAHKQLLSDVNLPVSTFSVNCFPGYDLK